MSYKALPFSTFILFALSCTGVLAAPPTPVLNLDDPILRTALLQQADSFIQRNPRDSRAFAMRAAIFLRTGQLDKALSDLNVLTQLNPDNAHYLDMKANAEAIHGDLNAAIADESAAIKLKPESAELYSNRSTMFLLANRLQEASADGTKAINLNSRLASAYENLAEIQFKMKNYKITIEYCNAAILRAPNFPDAYYFRGCAYGMMGNKPQAEQDKAKAKELGFTGTGTIFKGTYN